MLRRALIGRVLRRGASVLRTATQRWAHAADGDPWYVQVALENRLPARIEVGTSWHVAEPTVTSGDSSVDAELQLDRESRSAEFSVGDRHAPGVGESVPASNLTTSRQSSHNAPPPSPVRLSWPQKCDTAIVWQGGDVQVAAPTGPPLADPIAGDAATLSITGKLEGDLLVNLPQGSGMGPAPSSPRVAIALDKVRGPSVRCVTGGSVAIGDVVECGDVSIVASALRGKRLLVNTRAAIHVGHVPDPSVGEGGVSLQGVYAQQVAMTSVDGNIAIGTLHGTGSLVITDRHVGGDAFWRFVADGTFPRAHAISANVVGAVAAVNRSVDGTVRVHFDSCRGDSLLIAHGDIDVSLSPPFAHRLLVAARLGFMVTPGLHGLYEEQTAGAGKAVQSSLPHVLQQYPGIGPGTRDAVLGMVGAVVNPDNPAFHDDIGRPNTVLVGRMAAIAVAGEAGSPETRVNDPSFRPHELPATSATEGKRAAGTQATAPSHTAPRVGKVALHAPVTGFYDLGRQSSVTAGAGDGGESPIAALTRLFASTQATSPAAVPQPNATRVPSLTLVSLGGFVRVRVMSWSDRVTEVVKGRQKQRGA